MFPNGSSQRETSMAFHRDSIDHPAQVSAPQMFMGGIVSFFERMMEAQTRSKEVKRLERLSYAELAAMGLSRDTIVREVYRDVYCV